MQLARRWTWIIPACLRLQVTFSQNSRQTKPIHIPLDYNPPPALHLAGEDDANSLEIWAAQAGRKLNVRYGGQTHFPNDAASSRLVSRQVAHLPLTNAFSDAIYTAQVSMGTPPQNFNASKLVPHFQVDTGSADLWVADKSCGIEQGCPTAASKYDPTLSSTYNNLSKPFKVQYGSGKVLGNLATESVTIGGMTVLGQTFGACDIVENILRTGLDTSGILGLGWSGIATSSSTPAWESLLLQNAFKEPVISFALKRLINGDPETTGPGGMMTFGGTSPDHYRGDINFIPLSRNQTYWLIPLSRLAVGGVAIKLGTPDVAIDTGTSLIGGPPEALKLIFDAVPGARLMTSGSFNGYWTVPCQTKVEIAVQFGSVWYPLDPSDFNLGRLSGNQQCLTAFFGIQRGTKGAASIPEWIFGAAFLKNVYSVFRGSPPSIGFAQVSPDFSGPTDLSPSLVNTTAVSNLSSDNNRSKAKGNETRRKSVPSLSIGLICSFIIFLIS